MGVLPITSSSSSEGSGPSSQPHGWDSARGGGKGELGGGGVTVFCLPFPLDLVAGAVYFAFFAAGGIDRRYTSKKEREINEECEV